MKLEWSMCLHPESWQDSYEALMRDYGKLFAGEDMGHAGLDRRSHSLIGWLWHTSESVIEYDRMHVKSREWHYRMLVNGHMEVFGDVNGIGSLTHLETKVDQIPGVVRTRIRVAERKLRSCLVIFVSLTISSWSHRKMVGLIRAHVDAENAGVSLVGRQRADRYDFIEVDSSHVTSSLEQFMVRYDLVDIANSQVVSSSRFNVARYDSLDLSKSTAFQRFRRRRKYRERKLPNVNTIRGRLRIVFQNRKVIKPWIKTGEVPDVHA